MSKPFIEGDRVRIAEIPTIQKHFWAQEGTIVRWSAVGLFEVKLDNAGIGIGSLLCRPNEIIHIEEE